MSDQVPRATRSLFIVSNDYGELLLALMFLQDQKFAEGAAFLLPPRLHAANASSIGIPTHEYASLEDIVRVLEAWNPQVVALMSGYLFSNNKLLSRGNLRKLVGHLHGTRRRVLTSDPFLGLATTLSPHDVHLGIPRDSSSLTLAQRWSGPMRRRAERRIAKDLARVSHILSDVVHLYPVPTSGLASASAGRPVKRASFFNREVVAAASRPRPGGDTDPRRSHHGSRQRWLFVLAAPDVWYQQLQVGADMFAQRLAGRLQDAEGAGRQPCLLAPRTLLDQLAGHLPSRTTVELLDFCGYHEFTSRLIDAEYVFYWNLFSASFLLRASAGLPAFFFDRGHLTRLIGRMYPLALRVHLRDWEPQYLSLESTLDPALLAEQAQIHERQLTRVVAYWKESPTPDELLASVLQEQAANDQ